MADYLAGWHAVEACLLAGRRQVHQLLVDEGQLKGQRSPELKTILDMAGQRGLKPQPAQREFMSKKGGTPHHQGVLMGVGPYPYISEAEALEDLGPRSFLVVLDQIQDPHNLGAILRSAYFFKAEAVIIPERRTVEVTPAVVRASAGASEHLRVAQVTNLAEFIRKSKENGLQWVGMVESGGAGMDSLPWKFPLGWVIGNEGEGLRRLTRERCDHLVTLAGTEGLRSLNASVAAGIVLHETRRRLGQGA